MKIWSLIFGLIVGFCALAQQASPVLLGSWTATTSPNQIFRGTWSAQVSLRSPNRAFGSWTLVNEAGDVLLVVGAENSPALAGQVDSSVGERTVFLWYLDRRCG